MSVNEITLTYARDIGDLAVTLKGQDYGSDEVWSRRQEVGRTMGDQVYVYDYGSPGSLGDTLELNISLDRLTTSERGDLELFFRKLGFGRRWFTITLPAPIKAFPVRAGGSVSGSQIKAGGFTAGQYLVQDSLSYKVRLMETSLSFVEVIDSHYSVTLKLRVLSAFLPSNV